jgi:hypothetical protein
MFFASTLLSPTSSAYEDAYPICTIEMHYVAKKWSPMEHAYRACKNDGRSDNEESGPHPTGMHLLSHGSNTSYARERIKWIASNRHAFALTCI